MSTVFLHHLARNRGQIIGWSIGMILMGLLVIPLYDTIVAEAAQIRQLIRGLPPQLMAFFADPELDITSPVGYLSARYFSLASLILSVMVVLGGSGLIASDEENGTLDLFQAHPVSRSALFLGRLLAFVATLAAILGLAWLGVVLPAGTSENLGLGPGALALPFLPLLALLLVFGTLALLLSMLLPSRRMGVSQVPSGTYWRRVPSRNVTNANMAPKSPRFKVPHARGPPGLGETGLRRLSDTNWPIFRPQSRPSTLECSQ